MNKLSFSKSALLATTFLCVGLSAPAIAQDGANESDTIIVTARRVEERLQDVPISITVFNQQQLTARNVVNAGDLATYTPSLTANGRFGAENTSFAIRGFVQENGTAPSVAVYFADVAALRAAGGTTLGNGAGPGAFFDLQNVQVLKGSQGTLFGRNTTGGAVLLVPQKPTSKFEGYVEGSIGNYDMRRVQAVVNVPVMDTLRVRFGLDRQTRDGYLKNRSGVGPADFADTNYWAARVSVVADLTPNLENYIVGTWSDSDTNGFLPQLFTCAPGVLAVPAASSTGARRNAEIAQAQAQLGCDQIARRAPGDFYGVENATIAPRQHVQQWQLINTTTWKASDTLTIKNIASYGEFREFFRSSVYGENLILPAVLDLATFPDIAITPANVGKSLIKAQTAPPTNGNSAGESTFTEELQFQGSAMDDRLIWQAGGYLELSEPIGFTGSSAPSTVVCTTANSNDCVFAAGPLPSSSNPTAPGFGTGVLGRLNKQRFNDKGIYGQATYKLTDQFSVTAGARYTWDETTATTSQFLYRSLPVAPGALPTFCLEGGTPATGCLATFTQKASKPTWLLDLDYKPTEDILVYVKYARGYRAGGIKTDGGAAFAVFGPEKVDTYEAGFKTSWRGPVRGTFNVTGFYSDFSNQQLAARLDPKPASLGGTLEGSTPAQVIASVGKSRIYGVEVEAMVSPVEGLTIEGNYAYLNTKLESVTPLAGNNVNYFPPVATGTAPGQPLGYTPRNKYTITGTYTLPLDESIGKISVGATFAHSDSLISTAGYIIPVVAPTAVNPTPIVPVNVTGVNYGKLPALDLLNLNASWTSVGGMPVDLGFFVTNVTNKKYVTAVFGGIGAFGYDSRALGEPRMWGFRLKYHFGS